MNDSEGVEIRLDTSVRVVNWAGPCINYMVEKIGRTRVKMDGERFFYPIEIHQSPCQRCMDHPQTHYPRGYEG